MGHELTNFQEEIRTRESTIQLHRTEEDEFLITYLLGINLVASLILKLVRREQPIELSRWQP